MTGGFSGIPVAEEGGTPQGPHLAGVARILAPRWAKFPAITVGLLGVQVFWSVEMSYGAYTTPLASVPRQFLALTVQARPTCSPSASQRLLSP